MNNQRDYRKNLEKNGDSKRNFRWNPQWNYIIISIFCKTSINELSKQISKELWQNCPKEFSQEITKQIAEKILKWIVNKTELKNTQGFSKEIVKCIDKGIAARILQKLLKESSNFQTRKNH